MGFKKASIDTGIGAVKLTVHVRDAITGQVISENFTADNIATSTWSVMVTKQIDLGYEKDPFRSGLMQVLWDNPMETLEVLVFSH